MKTIGKLQIMRVFIIFQFSLYIFIANICNSQYSDIVISGSAIPNSGVFQYINYNDTLFGIKYGQLTSPRYGHYQPLAKFHVKSYLRGTPVFLAEATNALTPGSILLLSQYNSRNYGIYQQGSSFENIFEGSISCSSPFTISGSSGIAIVRTGYFPFSVQPAPPDGPTSEPLDIYFNGLVKVNDTLECKNIKVRDNRGPGKVLVSDDLGNGIWTDASNLNDRDWLVGPLKDGKTGVPPPPMARCLYSNPDYYAVGIGTTDPKSALHVENGNILISRSSDKIKAPGSTNGSVLFSDVINTNVPRGEWGIEYNTEFDDYESNGLNFWKPYTIDHHDFSGNYLLYLRNDGSVGIGTSDTKGNKLAVNGPIICTELKCKLYNDWPDNVLNKNYSLPSLAEVNKYIEKNSHLPGIPSAKEVKENGVNVGEMNALLLKKVEELTLYIISMKREIDELKAEKTTK